VAIPKGTEPSALKTTGEARASRLQAGLLAKLEDELLDRSAPLADLLRDCLVLSRHAGAARLQAWVTAELNGYERFVDVPDYRKIVAQVVEVIDRPYLGRSEHAVNVMQIPEPIRKHINDTVPLNQGVDELEALVSQGEAQNRPIQLSPFGADAYAMAWNRNPRRPYSVVALYWAINPASIRGALGRVRTALTALIVELLTEAGANEQQLSGDQVDQALDATVFKNSTINFFTNSQIGDVVRNQSRTVIKGNKTTIKDSSGNFAVASENVAQVSAEGIDVEKLSDFVSFVTEIASTLNLGPDQLADLTAGADEVRAAVADGHDRGRIRRAVDSVLKVLRSAGPTVTRGIAIGMGDDLMRELGSGVMHQLGH
jgi:hypothetical protein